MFKIRERLATHWASAKKHLLLVLAFVGVIWAVFLVDLLMPDEWLDLRQWGIHPRTVGGLFSIALAPFLHAEFGHIFANTMPLVVRGHGLSARAGFRMKARAACSSGCWDFCWHAAGLRGG